MQQTWDSSTARAPWHQPGRGETSDTNLAFEALECQRSAVGFLGQYMIFLWGELNSAPPAGVKATSSLGTGGEHWLGSRKGSC